jgi:hypothetical protein
MTTNPEATRTRAIGVYFSIAFAFILLAMSAYLYVDSARRNARFNAIESCTKGEADCRRMEAMYLELATEEQTKASNSMEDLERRDQHLANAEYYKKMAEDSHRIAVSNVEMIRELKRLLSVK